MHMSLPDLSTLSLDIGGKQVKRTGKHGKTPYDRPTVPGKYAGEDAFRTSTEESPPSTEEKLQLELGYSKSLEAQNDKHYWRKNKSWVVHNWGYPVGDRVVVNFLEEYYSQLVARDARANLDNVFPIDKVVPFPNMRRLYAWLETIVMSMAVPNLSVLMEKWNTIARVDHEQLLTEATGSTYVWFFSSSSTSGAINVKRAKWSGEDARRLVEGFGSKIAWTAGDSDKGIRCGATNCFTPSVDISRTDTETVETATLVRYMIKTVTPDGVSMDQLSHVALRAPKKYEPRKPDLSSDLSSGLSPELSPELSPDYDMSAEEKKTPPALGIKDLIENLREGLHEAFLSLHMAQKGLTAPIYAICPVFQREPRHGSSHAQDWYRPTECGFVYITESGWQDLHAFIKLQEDHKHYEMKRLGQSIVACLQLASQERIIFNDIKPENMIVNGDGDVRLIDFDTNLTLDIGRVENDTSPDCVFFINGLLLLNSVVKQSQAAGYHEGLPDGKLKLVFKDLCTRVNNTWKALRNVMKGEGNNFCWLLAKDKTFAYGLTKRQLSKKSWRFQLTESEDEFWESARAKFYKLIYHYSSKEDKKAHKAHQNDFYDSMWPSFIRPSYVEFMLNDITRTFA